MSKETENKVCLISRKFDKKSGRAEWIYAERLKEEIEKRGLKVSKIEQRDSDTKTSKLKKAWHDLFVVPTELLNKRLVEGIKVFHFLNENQSLYNWLIKATGAKTITTFHDFINLNPERKRLRYYYFSFIYKIASLSDVIICNSSETKKQFIKRYGNKKLIEVIPPVHYLNLFPKIKKKNMLRIGYIGGLDGRKRVMKLIELGEKIKKKNSSQKIEIWGKGGLRKELEKEIGYRKLGKIVSLKGYAPYEKISDIYNSFGFFFFPTREEGLGLMIIESISCGTPVIILKDAILPKEMRDCCLGCKNVDEVYRRIDEMDKKDYEKARKDAIKNSKRFNVEKNFDRLEKIYLNR